MTPCLLTGGCGYIGSHCYVALLEAGYLPVILDNYSNSDRGVPRRLSVLTGRDVIAYEGDVADEALVASIIKRHAIRAVIHFAALKSVSESVGQPLRYFKNNVSGLVSLLAAMEASGCRTLVYSSSAAVYGTPSVVPIAEDADCRPESPYGQTKLIGEQIIRAVAQGGGAAVQSAASGWRTALLRYFNPAGAHPSGLIGEAPQGVPANLLPYLGQVAAGLRPHVNIFGRDYPTVDGTGVRDYIHVMDLVEGHIAALDVLLRDQEVLRSFTVNLGTGRGHSVLEVIRAFEDASGVAIDSRDQARRSGDVAACWADPSLAEAILGWRAQRSLQQMCRDAWRWQQQAALTPSG